MTRFLCILFLFVASFNMSSLAYGVMCEEIFSGPRLTLSGFIFSPFVELNGQNGPTLLENYILETHHDVPSEIPPTERLTRNMSPMGGFMPSFSELKYSVLSKAKALLKGMDEIHKAYGDRLSHNTKRLVEKADWYSLSMNERTGFASVTQQEKIVGLLRVHDMTDYSSTKFESALKNRMESRAPFEVIEKDLGIQTSFLKPYQEQGFQIFELGKFYINESLSAVERDGVRRALLTWLYRNYLQSDRLLSDRVLFVIDVGSPAHARTYRVNFGAHPVDPTLFSPPLPFGEAILTVELGVLKEKIENILNFSKIEKDHQ